MREDYDAIHQQFEGLIGLWMGRSVEGLAQYVHEDIHAWISTQASKDGAAHSLYGIRQFILDTPAGKNRWHIGNDLCRVAGNTAWQMAEVACVSANETEQDFRFIAAFSNHWEKESGVWRLVELRMDVQDFESSRQEEFAKVWFFDDHLARLTPTVHIPCIFPDMDNPYFRIPQAEELLNEEEKVAECWYKFNTGMDHIMFLWVKETLADDFQNDSKRHFIAEQKFRRQRYRYRFSGCRLEDIQIDGDTAIGISRQIVPEETEKKVHFVKRDGRWQILNVEGGISFAKG